MWSADEQMTVQLASWTGDDFYNILDRLFDNHPSLYAMIPPMNQQDPDAGSVPLSMALSSKRHGFETLEDTT